jgi:hypothetical protein
MMRYKVRMRQWLQDMDLGFKMLARRKLDLTPSKIDKPEEVRQLFAGSEKDGKH